MLFQVLINSLVIGSIYALIAFGFSLLYNTFKFVPFFYGSFAILTAYLNYNLQTKLNFYLSIFLSFILSLIIAYFLDILIFENFRKRKASQSIFLTISIALAILLENLILAIWGADVKMLSLPFENKIFSIYSFRITLIQIIIFLVTLAFLILSLILIYFTKFGLKIRALAENQEMAEILGINKKQIFLQVFFFTTLVAFLVSNFYAFEYNLEPTAGTKLIVKSFASSIIGGLDTIPSAFLGGYLLALIENFSIIYLPSSFKDGIAFLILFLFLLFRPKGIFGRQKREEIGG